MYFFWWGAEHNLAEIKNKHKNSGENEEGSIHTNVMYVILDSEWGHKKCQLIWLFVYFFLETISEQRLDVLRSCPRTFKREKTDSQLCAII